MISSVQWWLKIVHLDPKAPAWLQACLPVKYGGLGVRSAAMLVSSAFLSSAFGSFDLIHQVLPERVHDNPYPVFAVDLQVWKQGHFNHLPSSPVMPAKSLGTLHMLKPPLTSCLSHQQIRLLMHGSWPPL